MGLRGKVRFILMDTAKDQEAKKYNSVL